MPPRPSMLILGLNTEDEPKLREALAAVGLEARLELADSDGASLEQVVQEMVDGLALQNRLARAARELRVLEAAMDQARDGMVVTDVRTGDGGPRITWVNPAFATLVGETAGALIGQPLYRCAPVHTSQRRIAHSLAKRGSWEGELTFGPLDALRHLEIRISAVRDGEGEVAHYVGIFRDITDKKRVEDRLQHLAHHDHLTGLPNRKLLLDRLTLALARARRYASALGVLFIDLDGFKAINDTLGHAVGDKVLIEVSERLRGLVRASDTVARLGGDEFVVLLPEVRTIDNAQGVADKVLDVISEVIRVGDHELFVTPSIGLAVWPDHGDEVDDLLQRADQAMYAAKAAGKAGCVTWRPELAAEERTRADLVAHLRQSFDSGGFHVDGQPIVNVQDGVVAVGVFLRWTDPERGPVSPASFLSLLGEAGLGLRALELLLTEGARAVRGRDLSLAVDVRPEWLVDEHVVQRILQILGAEGLTPERLWVEVAEAHLLELPAPALEALHALRDRGARVVVDHYGTSHLSVPLLRRLPLDALKLHGSLTGALGKDDALVRGLVTLCRSLELGLLAEGVSGFAQRDVLAGLGVIEQEGPLHGRPGPLAGVLDGLVPPSSSAAS